VPPSTSDSSPKPIPPGRTSPGSVGGTFERLLVRFALADGERWVLKGGAAVEVRMADRARTTKDIDLAARHTDGTDADVREALVDVLLSDPQGDFFEFRLDKFRAMGIHGAMGPVWRASVDCRLDGRTFDHVVVDVVVRTSEVQRTELITLPGTLSFADLPTVGRRPVPALRREAPRTGP